MVPFGPVKPAGQQCASIAVILAVPLASKKRPVVEAKIVELVNALAAAGDGRTGSGSVPVYR